jgi:hypothetical protein
MFIMHDMSIVWGNILRDLREGGEMMLYAACAELETVHFTEDTIEITCGNDATFNLLTKHRTKLGPRVNIHKNTPNNFLSKSEIIEKLEDIFGEKLTVKK